MLDNVLNIVTFLFADIASIAIVCLAALELLSYLFFTRPLAKVRKQVVDILRFKHPLNSLSLILWIILFVLSIWCSHNTSPISSTLLGLGTTLFFIGWLIRYPPYLMETTLRKHQKPKGFLRSYHSLWTKLRLHIKNRDLYGPWIEIIGITVISKSLIIFVPAAFLFPIVQGAAAISEYRKRAVISPHTNIPSAKDLVPKVGNIFSIVLLPFVVALMVGIVTREFALFNADFETAKSVLFSLSQIEGSIGILAITVIFVLVQLTASNYSTRIPAILFRQPAFWGPLFVLFASITYNLLIASRAPTIFPAGYFQSLLVDLSFVLGIATACAVTYFIFRAPRIVSPESIIAYSLKSFDKKWLDIVKRDWCKPNFQITLNISHDPFVAIERILSRAIESGDSLTFVSGLILILDHLCRIKDLDPRDLPNYILEIDAYLRHHFRSLVRSAARNSDAYSLLMLIYFIEELGQPSTESIEKCNIYAFGFDDAAGELLLREIIRQSTEHQLTECVIRAIHITESRAGGVIKSLPKQTDTWRYNQLKFDPEVSDEEKHRLWDNDHRVENFERQYFSYLQSVGVKAADSKSTEVVRSIVLSLNQLISSITQDINGHTMKARMVWHAVGNLGEVSEAIINNKLSNLMTLSMLDHAIEHTDADHDELVAWHPFHSI